MTTAAQVLDRARSQIGTAENPAGSNRVRYSKWYGLNGPWCAMFVSWCTFNEGLALPASTSLGFAYTPSGAKWFKERNHWSARPETGRLVFFDFPGDDIHRISHVGLVESVAADGTLTTIEGNVEERGGHTGGKVMRRMRRTGIVGFGVVDYEPAGTTLRDTGMLQEGSTGPKVRQVQARLVALGFRIDVDGEFGPHTKAAVIAFQRTHGLEADGVVGPITEAALKL